MEETGQSLIKKSVFAIHVVPLSGALGINQRKIQIALAKLAGEQYRKLSEDLRHSIESAVREYVGNFRDGKLRDVPAILMQPRFHAKLTSIAEMIGHDPKVARQLKPFMRDLQSIQVQFNALRHSPSKNESDMYPGDIEVVTSLLSSFGESGRGEIMWAYDPIILSIMVNPQTYAQLNLELVRNARTYTALALYENTKRFVAVGRAGPYPVRKWQELLSQDGKIPSWETVTEFRKKVKRAIQELEACEGCDIVLTVEESKSAENSQPMMTFKVHMRSQSALVFGEPVPENRDLFDQLESFGIQKNVIRGLIDAYGEEYILAKINVMKRSKKVTDQAAWLIAAIKNDYMDQEMQKEKSRKNLELIEQKTREKEKLKSEFENLRGAAVEFKLAKMDESEQAYWKKEFLQTETGKGISELKKENLIKASMISWLKTQPGWIEDPELQDFETFLMLKV